MKRRWTSVLALLLAYGVPRIADAADDDAKVEWSPEWERVRPWEYVVGPTLVGGALAVRYGAPQADVNWRGGVLFDDAVIDAFAVRGGARSTIASITDGTLYGALAYRFADSAFTPGLGHGNWDVSLQMSFIDLESLGIVLAVTWGLQTVVVRERAYVEHCRNDPSAIENEDCGRTSELNRSFIAGHTATGVAEAALTCLHHSHMPLYGGGVGDDLACGVMIGAAVMNGAGRIMTENHYTSDVILGVGLGFFAGYVVPKTLHYGWGRKTVARPRGPSGAGLFVMPTVNEGGPGLVMVGRF